MLITKSKPTLKTVNQMTFVNYTKDSCYDHIWETIDPNLRNWFPHKLVSPGRSQVTFHSPDKWLLETYWFRDPMDTHPEYYWLEKKEGLIITNYLPVSIKKMLKEFQNTFGKPSTRGAVYVYSEKEMNFSFTDVKFEQNKWVLFEDKIEIHTNNTLYKSYLYKSKEFVLV